MNKEKINRINELSKKKKTVGLTEEELKEQAALRCEYIDAFKASLEGQLENIRIIEPDGTVHKVEKKK